MSKGFFSRKRMGEGESVDSEPQESPGKSSDISTGVESVAISADGAGNSGAPSQLAGAPVFLGVRMGVGSNSGSGEGSTVGKCFPGGADFLPVSFGAPRSKMPVRRSNSL